MSDEMSDSPPVIALSPEKIIADRQAAQAKLRNGELPDSPMDAAVSDVISPESFNTMASKLEKAMKEVMEKGSIQKDRTAAPDTSDKKRTNSKAEPKPEDKQSEPHHEMQMDASLEPEHITGARAADWNKLKAARAQAEKAAKEWEDKYSLTSKEYDEFRKKVGDPTQSEAFKKQLEEITAERDKLDTQVRQMDIERSESFNSFYKQKFDNALAIAKDAAGKEHADEVEQLLSMPPSKFRKQRLNDILEGLDGLDAQNFGAAVVAYDTNRMEREAQIKDTKSSYEKIKAVEAANAEQAKKLFAHRTEAAMASVLSVAAASADAFRRGDDKEHNKFVEESEDYVKAFFAKKLPDHEVALLPVLAREAKHLSTNVLPALRKKVAELENALGQYRGASPGPASGAAPGAVGPGGRKEGFIDIFHREWPQGNR